MLSYRCALCSNCVTWLEVKQHMIPWPSAVSIGGAPRPQSCSSEEPLRCPRTQCLCIFLREKQEVAPLTPRIVDSRPHGRKAQCLESRQAWKGSGGAVFCNFPRDSCFVSTNRWSSSPSFHRTEHVHSRPNGNLLHPGISRFAEPCASERGCPPEDAHHCPKVWVTDSFLH